MDVALAARREPELSALAQELEKLGVRAAALPADLSDLGQVDPLIERAEAALGPLDLLVNNAGLELHQRLLRLHPRGAHGDDRSQPDRPLAAHPPRAPEHARPWRGHVVFIASVAGKLGPAYQAPYAATKAGLIGLTQSLRSQYRHGTVGFSVVCPGFIAGDGMYQRMVQEGMKSNRLMGETTLERVCDATVRAVRRDLPEVIESGAPLRPALALAQVAPGLAERIAPRFGVTELFRRTAVLRGRGG